MIDNNELINQIKSYNRFLNIDTVNKAYNFAVEAHQNQKRDEGVPYIIHPVAVAKILTELKLDSATITTGLLHDTIEDTNVTYESVKKEFGEEVANLVDGVTKISALENKASDDSKAENFRKLILATSKDIRVLLVKLADRLHNMRTIQFVKDKEKKIKKAKETMEIYAPLAERMGMNTIRDELEDLSFSVLNKPARDLIIERLQFIKNNKDDTFKSISSELIELLNKNGVEATITGREKSPFSIWRKIQNKKVSLEQLTDIIGFRIIVKNVEDCYKTLGIFHSKFPTIPGRFKDYISTPKINKYQSIHSAVIGPRKNRIEIQIRTFEMNEFAERGIASHWKYKSSEKFSDLSWKEYDWLRDLVEIIEAGNSPEHYYEFTKLQMFQENVFCFTPKGSVIKLPKLATPIDFAYAVHTKIGDSAIGCFVNGRETTLQNVLNNGDMVRIETSKNASPSLHWLSSAKTGKARAALAKLDHLVVQDIFLTETAMFADVILPAAAWPEKTGTVTNTNRQVQMGRQAIKPPGHAKPDWWITNQIAQRLGLSTDYSQPKDIYLEMQTAMSSLKNIDWDRLDAEHSVTYPCPAPDQAGFDIVFADGFPTADKRGKFVPADVLPPNDPLDEKYSFILTTGRLLEHWHTGAISRRSDLLNTLEPEAFVQMNQTDCMQLNIQPGDTVQVTSRRGSIQIKVRIDDKVQPGLVFIPFAFVESSANLLTSEDLDPSGKIPEFKYCAAKIEKIN